MGLQDLDIDFDLISGLIVIAVVTIVVSFGGFPATRRVGSVRPIEVLREPTQSRGAMTLVRSFVAAATLSIAAAMTWSLVSGDNISGGNQILVIGPMFTASMAAAGPAVFPAILRMWTALVPARLSASWFLARNAAQFQATRSTATINALLVTIALPGSLYAGFATLGNATAAATGNRAGSLAPASFLLLVGGSLLVSLSGAAATVLMATRTREQEAALVQAAGGTRTVVLLRAVWEALILVITAILASAIVLALTAGGVALSLSRVAATAPDFGLGQAGFASAACAIILVAASAIPVLLALRQPIRAVLVASE
ncbi:hypothetical protein [Curtobacterium sp. MCBD17_023]|uniref:hypothetical protein n=1 Tax=Curtobacterium sp. MCBD17_023 TaxID=2175657 RepID=UPI0015E8940E|nr:hypothetical protein [Curtobacterium sp. MCBD17_023]